MVDTKNKNRKSGFTLIELIISLGVFAVVVTIAVGALLMLVATNEQLQQEQNVMSNLSFALDSMTREIRTGTEYLCIWANNPQSAPGRVFTDLNADLDDPELSDRHGWGDCRGGNPEASLKGIVFTEAGDSITGDAERILYFFYDGSANNSDLRPGLYRRIGTNPPVILTASELFIRDAEFYVSGIDPLSDGDEQQPTVRIMLEASGAPDSDSEIVIIQTTVSQRTLDL